MKIAVGGASGVGKSIIGYLSLGNNDIAVVDPDPAKLDEVSKEYDVQPVCGSISYPDIQESIGMKDTDMLIAVTGSDEVNMIACQVAHTLFKVPRKIARVDSKYFLNPLWNTLYNEKNLPIDLVITPDLAIGKFITSLYDLPGSSAVFPFCGGDINVFAFRNRDTDIPFMKFSLDHINQKLAETEAKIVLILRGGRRILPGSGEEVYLQRNDLIYICCPAARSTEIMRLFGVDHNPYEKVVMFGANAISRYVAAEAEKYGNSCRIVEDDPQKAAEIAEKLDKTSVICGEMMSDVILRDAGFSEADLSIAVTDRDKDNLLISLLASKNKDTQALSLVNSRDYNLLAANIRNNVIIDRSSITISAILHYLRKARINEAYSLGRNTGEFWEVRLGEDSLNTGRTVKELGLPGGSSLMAVIRDDAPLFEAENIRFEADDKLLMFVAPSDIREVERIFYL